MLQRNALQVETRTKSDISDKGRQLQQLVGGSYRCEGVDICTCTRMCSESHKAVCLCRELISSADTIVAMAACCGEVVSQLNHLQVCA